MLATFLIFTSRHANLTLQNHAFLRLKCMQGGGRGFWDDLLAGQYEGLKAAELQALGRGRRERGNVSFFPFWRFLSVSDSFQRFLVATAAMLPTVFWLVPWGPVCCAPGPATPAGGRVLLCIVYGACTPGITVLLIPLVLPIPQVRYTDVLEDDPDLATSSSSSSEDEGEKGEKGRGGRKRRGAREEEGAGKVRCDRGCGFGPSGILLRTCDCTSYICSCCDRLRVVR